MRSLQLSLKFIDKAVKDDKPFFVWHNTTRMHVFTHLSKKYQDMVAEKGFYGAGMTEFDDDIGVLLETARRSQASPTIPSSSSRPTTAPRSSLGRMVAARRSAAKRPRPGKAASACRRSSAGLA